MADVFLSYAQEDHSVAKLVASLLESCGWAVFWDHRIKPGAEWRTVLESELDNAAAVVVLWSRVSVNSLWVKAEAERGQSRLVSVRLDNVDLPIPFGQLQAINLIGWRGGKVDGIDNLVSAVSESLRKPALRSPVVPPSPKRKWWIAAGMSLVVALVTGYFIAQYLSKPAPIMNQEIVIDTSDGMKDPFDTAPTKLAAAVDALHKRNLHPTENLALRAFGGACHEDDGSRLLVSFGTTRRERIERAARGLQTGGQSTLVSGVISAITDVKALPHTRRVVVLTGHSDKCEEEALRDIKTVIQADKEHPVDLEMRFIGLGVKREDEPKVREISEAVGGQAYFTHTVKELNDVLDYVLEFEPAVIHVKSVWKVVDEVGRSVNQIAQNMNQRKFDEAQKILDAGRASYAQAKPSFDSLAGVALSVDFQRFYKLAAENRALQEQALEVGNTGIQHGRASGERQSPNYVASIEAWNELMRKYNANIGEMNRLTNAIVNEARKRS
jgi:hypothetical protein